MKKVGNFIVKARYALLVVFAGLVVISGILMSRVKINYDMTKYLDDSSSSSTSLEIMQKEFGSVGQCQYMVSGKNLTFDDAEELSTKITAVEGVASVIFAEDSEDENYYKTENGIHYALYKVFLTTGNYDTKSYDTLDDIDAVIKDFSDTHYIINTASNGAAVENDFLTSALDKDMVIILTIVAIVVLIILTIVSTSWIEPLIFAIVVVGSILINMGSNILLNHISYINNSMSFITKSIAAVMQLALSMDYAIILLHSYKEMKNEYEDKHEAMANAIAKSFAPVSSSSLTTVAGLVALMFMSFSIGFDVGLVLAKGIVISLLCVFLFMPAILLIFDKLLVVTSHRSIDDVLIEYNEKRIARFKRHGKEAPTFSGFQQKTKFLIPAIACLVILVGAIMNFKSEYSFVLEASTDKNATVNVDNKKVTDTFGTQNTLVVLLPKETYTYSKELSLIDYMDNYTYKDQKIINSKQGLTTYGINIPLTSKQTALTFGIDADAVSQLYTMMKTYDPTHVMVVGSESYITPENLINFAVKNNAITTYTANKQTELNNTYDSYKNSLYTDEGKVNNVTLTAMSSFVTAYEAGLVPQTDESTQQYTNYKTLTTVINKQALQAKYSFITDDMAGYIIQSSTLREDDTHVNTDTMYYFEVITFLAKNDVLTKYGSQVNTVLAEKQVAIKKAYASLASQIYNDDKTIKTDALGNVVLDNNGYVRIIFNMDMDVSGEDSFKAINEITDHIYDNYEGVQVVSETFVYSQIKDVFNRDIVIVNLISFFAILMIIAITFKSCFVPVLLTALIQGAIWITMGISTMAGQDIFFVCYIVVMCVQMGATIDYAILITSNYTRNRKTMNKINAMGKAMNSSLMTIFTSGSILILATLIIGLVSKVKIISDLGLLLSRGCAISVFSVIFCLPQFLMLCDKIIEKTSLGTKFYNTADAEFEEIKINEKHLMITTSTDLVVQPNEPVKDVETKEENTEDNKTEE